MKPAYILMLARVVTLHNAQVSHSVRNDFRLLGQMLIWTLPVVVLMILQHDFGSTLVFLAIFAGVVLISGISWKIILPVAIFAVVVGGGTILLVTQSWGRVILERVGFEAYQLRGLTRGWIRLELRQGIAISYGKR